GPPHDPPRPPGAAPPNAPRRAARALSPRRDGLSLRREPAAIRPRGRLPAAGPSPPGRVHGIEGRGRDAAGADGAGAAARRRPSVCGSRTHPTGLRAVGEYLLVLSHARFAAARAGPALDAQGHRAGGLRCRRAPVAALSAKPTVSAVSYFCGEGFRRVVVRDGGGLRPLLWRAPGEPVSRRRFRDTRPGARPPARTARLW